MKNKLKFNIKNLLKILPIISAVILVFAVSCTESTRQYRETRINFDSLAASIPKSDTLTFITKETSDSNSTLKYLIVLSYPELIHYDNDIIQKKINNSISVKLNEIIELFKIEQEYMFSDTANMNLPENFDDFESRKSYLMIIYEILNNDRDLMSVIFNVEQYNAFAAHPISYHKTLNFDMKSGEEITLSKFIPESDSTFIDRVSEISYDKIMKLNLSDSVWVRNGLLPLWDNFKNYNITRKSLILTFDIYQVAPYSSGPVRISIPWESLQIDSLENKSDVITE